MPSPIDLITDPVSLGVFALYAAILLWEFAMPARALPTIPGWRRRAGLSFVVYFFLSSYLPYAWDPLLAKYQLFDLSALAPLQGAFVGLLVYNGLLYLWHRSLHASNWLWRAFHQMHHSAERIEAAGAFYFSPLDMAGFTLLGSLALTLVVGLSADAVTLFLYAAMFLGIFQHANVRTPRWLGYVIQRPESHAVYHRRTAHRDNYCDLPIIDMLFGTFRNPSDYPDQAGFHDGASGRITDMLLWRDVTARNNNAGEMAS
ncbi:MAG: sterol desaturase family protein [Pseudomonadota bacterium]